MEWCEGFAKKCSIDHAWEMVMMLVWQVWNVRNRWVFERKKDDPARVCARMVQLLGEFEVAQTRDEPHASPPEHGSHVWKPPSIGTYKINTDAAVTKEGKIGLGMVVRDGVGDVLMSAGRSFGAKMNVLEAEAEAARFGLKYAFDAGFRSVEMELDCLALVQLLRARKKEKSAAQIVVNDIFNLVASFGSCVFRFASRTCNVVAHTMAKVSLSYEETLVFMEDFPLDVLPLVIADKALIE